MQKIMVLFNPSAGKGRSAHFKTEIQSRLNSLSVPHHLFITKSEEHLRTLVMEKHKEHCAVIGAGGDSTISIIIDEMMKNNVKIPVGVISTGSSNDIAREFGIETQDTVFKALKRQRTKKIDLGVISRNHKLIRYYIGQANIGLGSYVAGYVEELAMKRPLLGKHQILAGLLGIRGALKREDRLLSVRIKTKEQDIKGQFLMAIFNNIKYWATGRCLDPSSRPDDGVLNCCLVKSCSIRRILSLSRLSQKQRLSEASEIIFLKAKEYDVTAQTPFMIQVDGELLGGFKNPQNFLTASFRVMPSACEIIC
jgi:diacylglycerol kinase family enzyme